METSEQQLNVNGLLTGLETPFAGAFNRSLRYGDGLFETMYWDGFQISNESFHLDRLFEGLGILGFDLSAGFDRDFIRGEIARLGRANAAGSPARVRLNVYREDNRQLLPTSNKPLFVIESSGLSPDTPNPLRL